MSDGLGGQINVEISRNGVGHHERWTCQVGGFHLAVDTALEISIAGENRTHDEAGFVNSGFDGIVQRTGVSNAGRAAVAHRVEAHGVQIVLQTCCFVVFGDHAAAGSQRGTDPRLDL